tara:strand:- start:828 stop:995 length:168 start_codon:yes stop_codon:yes gene_type:complete
MSRIKEVDIENITKNTKRSAKVRAVAEDIYEIVDNTEDQLSGIEQVEEYLLKNVL